MTLRDKESSSSVDLAAIRQRAEQATPGPWKAEDIGAGTVACGVVAESGRVIIEHDFVAPNNAEFIARARTDIPALLAHLALLEAQQTAQTWQDIATAPKDGTVVLLWWRSDWHRDHELEFWACGQWQEFGDGSRGWCGESFHTSEPKTWTRLLGERPTHWMPLPPAPSPKEPQP